MTDGFVEAYAKSTGLKQEIPQHWLNHPVLGRNFELTPSSRAGEEKGAPDGTWTRAQLDQHAAELGLDPAGLPNKAAVLEAITAAAEADRGADDDADGEGVDELDDPTSGESDPLDNADPQNSDDNPPSDQTPAAGENQE